MSTPYDAAATHVVNKFVEKSLIDEGLIAASDYTGLTFFIPAQQQPEISNLPTNIPFIVYNYVSNAEYVDWFKEHEQVAYTIYCDSGIKLRRIVTYLLQLLRRYEWVAEEINDYVDASPSPAFDWAKSFNIKYTRVTNATSPEPTTEEGGRQAAMVVFSLCFTHELDQNGMRV